MALFEKRDTDGIVIERVDTLHPRELPQLARLAATRDDVAGWYLVDPAGAEVDGTALDVSTPPDSAPPARNASTDLWRTWAAEHGGITGEEAARLSRDQLADRFAPAPA